MTIRMFYCRFLGTSMNRFILSLIILLILSIYFVESRSILSDRLRIKHADAMEYPQVLGHVILSKEIIQLFLFRIQLKVMLNIQQ